MKKKIPGKELTEWHEITCVTCERIFEERCTLADTKDRECECCNNGEHRPEWTDAVNIYDDYVMCEGQCTVCEADLEGEFSLNHVEEI